MSFDSLLEALKGGKGSGNFGHAGIPKHRGGSAPGGASGIPLEDVPFDTIWGRGYFIRLSDGAILGADAGEEHHEFIRKHPKLFGIKGNVDLLSDDDLIRQATTDKHVQVRALHGSTYIYGPSLNKSNLRKLQDLSLDGKLPQNGAFYWSDSDGKNVEAGAYSDFMNAKYIIKDGPYLALKSAVR